MSLLAAGDVNLDFSNLVIDGGILHSSVGAVSISQLYVVGHGGGLRWGDQNITITSFPLECFLCGIAK